MILDAVHTNAISMAPVLVDAVGRPAILACGGTWRRSVVGWQFEVGEQTVTVSVPSTLAALEARDAQWKAQVAA